MSTTYKVRKGDTFETIARKKYGDASQSGLLSSANPGTIEPLTAGTILTIPPAPNAPQNLQTQTISNSDEVAILIDGKRFRFWTNVRVTRSVDAMDTVQLMSPFESDNKDFRSIFKPFSFKKITVTVGGSPIFTGTMIGVNPSLENGQKIVNVSGYSLPGVLNDCTAPASSFPLEFNEQGLKDIAQKLASPFGLSVTFNAEQGAPFERVACNPDKKILEFIAELARQRNLIISSNSRGSLLVWKSIDTGTPLAKLEQGSSPVLSVTSMFNPQNYYSNITGIEPVSIIGSGSQFTVKNNLCNGVIRPLTFNVLDTDSGGIKKAVESKVGRMFGNMVTYSVTVNTWRDPQGYLWNPNTLINLLAPDAMVYNEYIFLIRSVSFERQDNQETAVLNLVIPGAFSGKIPESLPWDD